MFKKMKKYKNYINGKWVEASSKRTFEDRNPADAREVVGVFPRSNARDVDAAVCAASSAYDSWRKVPAPKKGEMIFRCARILESRKEALARAMTKEMGKVIKEARGDVQEAIDMAYLMAGEGRRLFGETTPSELPNKFAMTLRMPIGVCGLITPWNFPIAIPSWKVFPALICGNTIVFKPASDTPLLATLFVEALTQGGIPKGVVNLVHGTGDEVGKPIASHPDIRLISFTGSSEVGRRIAETGGSQLKRVSLEMGGKNAQIVMDDADLDLAIEGALWGAFGTTGQRCTATSRLILHSKIAKRFIAELVRRAKALKIGNGLDEKVEVGPLINEKQREKVSKYIEIGKKEGARLLLGGAPYKKGSCKYGTFFEPTIFTDVRPQMRIAQEEIFGPVVSVIEAKGLDDAISITNGTEYGLSSSIYTRDANKAFKAIRDIEAGITYINGPTIGAETHLPFGGVKNTGNGHREAGRAVLDIFSEWKTVFVDYSGRLQKAQIDRD